MKAKRLLSLLLTLFLLLGYTTSYADSMPNPTVDPNATEYDKEHPENLEEGQLACAAAIVIEESSGNPIFEKNADAIMYPASTTKIMTVLLGILYGNLEDVVTVSYAGSEAGVKAMLDENSSVLGLREGEEIVLEDLLYGTLIRSGNDGTIAIAEHIAGSEAAFVEMMNAKAYELGMYNTHFANSHGLHDPTHFTTAEDMSILARAAMQNETFRAIASTTSYNMPKTNKRQERTITSGHRIMNPSETSYYYEYMTGIKSGSHSDAGYCFVGAAEKDGVNLISVVFYSNRYYVWHDTKKLMEYGFSQYQHVSLEDLYHRNPLKAYILGYDKTDRGLGELELSISPSYTGESAEITATKDEIEYLAENLRDLVHVEYTRELMAPVTSGETMGVLSYVTDGGTLIEYDLIATRSIPERSDKPLTIEQIEAKTDSAESLPPDLTSVILSGAIILVLLTAVFSAFGIVIWRMRRHYARLPKNKNRYVK